MLKRFGRSAAATKALGWTLTVYLHLVHKTSRFAYEPIDVYDYVERDAPVILAMWHGQHFLAPFLRRTQDEAVALVSRHRDGEINAQVVRRFGIGMIRGSGDHNRQFLRKGGAVALRELTRALAAGRHVFLTADVPKTARRCGLGVITLAQISGRPIYPIAAATSRRIELKSWDRATVNLPFSKGIFIAGDPILVPANIDKIEAERYRQAVEDALNAVNERAYAIVDQGRGPSS